MRALAAILILSACSCLHAHKTRGLQSIRNILNCGVALGPARCLNAFTAYRAERALIHPDEKSNLNNDLEQFPWEKFTNSSDEALYNEACDGTEKLLRRQALKFTMIPGYRLELLSKGNGSIGIDIYTQAEPESGRSSVKKAKKVFFKIFPFLVLPGLIMSAVLPFMLPALKFLTLGAGMINNMALTGAVFTLLRNNAFNDNYEHKVIYLNKGYQNERLKHAHSTHVTSENYHVEEQYHHPDDYVVQEMESIEEVPLNSDWIRQYYAPEQNVQIVEEGPHIRVANHP